jgi:CubicO group peptidase (beta-lactamase class C family)
LGLAYVAASLRAAGHDVSVVDAVGLAPDQVTKGPRPQLAALGLTPREIVEKLDPDADAFGVTNMWSFSWNGIAGTEWWYDPKNDLFMIFMQQDRALLAEYQRKNRTWIYDALVRP